MWHRTALDTLYLCPLLTLGLSLLICRFTTEVLLKAKAGTELVAGTASVEELVEHADGFAEVFPEHK